MGRRRKPNGRCCRFGNTASRLQAQTVRAFSGSPIVCVGCGWFAVLEDRKLVERVALQAWTSRIKTFIALARLRCR